MKFVMRVVGVCVPWLLLNVHSNLTNRTCQVGIKGESVPMTAHARAHTHTLNKPQEKQAVCLGYFQLG